MKLNVLKMKRIIIIAILVVIVFCISFSSCTSTTNNEYIKDYRLSVVIEEGNNFTAKTTSYKVNAESNLIIPISFGDDYYFNDCNYEDYEITKTLDGVNLTLNKVLYNTRLKIDVKSYPVITINENDNFTTDLYRHVVKTDEDIVLTIKVNEEMNYIGCSYLNSTFVVEDDNKVIVILKQVKEDINIEFNFEKKPDEPVEPDEPIDPNVNPTRAQMMKMMPQATESRKYMYYCLNGGRFIHSTKNWGYYKQLDLENHLRSNTDIGTDIIKRDGYQLIGWNTQEDGLGEHVGLGSRVTVGNENMILYAEWKKWTDIDNFEYEEIDNEIKINKYKTTAQVVDSIVIPDFINEKKVTTIENSFASDITIKELYFPLYLNSVNVRAFDSCIIESIYFYDSVDYLTDSSMKKTIVNKIHINAVEAPCYSDDEFSYFADDMDRLILNKDKKKMIFFGGCAFSYGLISSDVQSAFPKYVVCNMGVIGGTNAAFQMDCISHYCTEGDIFIHAPEEMSEYQLMYSNYSENRMYRNVEGNYDLLSLVDFSKFQGGIFNTYYEYHEAKKLDKKGSYSSHCDHYNEYGDILLDYSYDDKDGNQWFRNGYGLYNHAYEKNETGLYRTDYVTEEGINRLKTYYAKLESAGAKVYFTFSPINESALSDNEKNNKLYEEFEKLIKQYLVDYPIISKVTNYMYTSEFFFDKDYHLNSIGASLRTISLINDIKDSVQYEK